MVKLVKCPALVLAALKGAPAKRGGEEMKKKNIIKN